MTNIEYRRSRGTDHPFTATKKQAKKAWYAINKDAIEARKKDQKRKSKKWTQLDYMNTDLYEKDDE